MYASQHEQAVTDSQPSTGPDMKLDSLTTLWWKDVFNADHKRWGYITYARDAAMNAAYPYFAWSGRVYFTGTGRDTSILERDVL